MAATQKMAELARFLRREPDKWWMRLAVTLMTILGGTSALVFVGLTVWLLKWGPPTEGSWDGRWTKDRISFLMNMVGSFAGSLPIIGLGYVTVNRLKAILQGSQQQAATPQGALGLMAHDLGKKLVFLRFGYFTTTTKEYKSVLRVAHGQDHIWDYHVHIAPFNWREPGQRDEAYLDEFFTGNTNEACEIKVLNSYLVDVRPLTSPSAGRFGDLVEEFKLHGLTDVLITAVYLNADRDPEAGLVPLERLQRDQLLIENIAYFLQERPYMGIIPPARQREFFEKVQQVADLDIAGTARVLFPGKGLPAESVQSTELKKRCIALRDSIAERRTVGDDTYFTAKPSNAPAGGPPSGSTSSMKKEGT